MLSKGKGVSLLINRVTHNTAVGVGMYTYMYIYMYMYMYVNMTVLWPHRVSKRSIFESNTRGYDMLLQCEKQREGLKKLI